MAHLKWVSKYLGVLLFLFYPVLHLQHYGKYSNLHCIHCLGSIRNNNSRGRKERLTIMEHNNKIDRNVKIEYSRLGRRKMEKLGKCDIYQ